MTEKHQSCKTIEWHHNSQFAWSEDECGHYETREYLFLCWHFPGVLVRFSATEFISKNWLISSTINSFGWWYDDDRMATWNALICLGLDSQFCKETFREKYSILAASMQPARSRAKRSFTCCFVFESTNDKMHLLERKISRPNTQYLPRNINFSILTWQLLVFSMTYFTELCTMYRKM